MMTRAWRAFVSIALVLALISIYTEQADLVKVGKPVVNSEAKGILAAGQNTNTYASVATSIHHDDPSDIPTDYETEIITETIAVTHVVTGGDECEIPLCAVVEICNNRNLTHAEIMNGISDINERLCMDPACTSTDHSFLLVDYYEVSQARGYES
ncbi:hypothetical protein SARC_10729 [Sphaeroforma arctica JP610]|uniref:Uncharacterized protein n=1 Tax=Sphaeroforma arctica JP610 TaxID=667725 RepID=A0A0L0FJ39_9EUKA|nr:hypothetical protein SARC_10729 [Sphaeroforma arctica JP610]KNC76792.1 hypothetical protein SARC_10729 [Sphaeroforma arctica JP610]|eukprot:XP_014150694.1 hypothetical protein SARC_10729 [Sphaeroforma arctica JP610]